MPFELTLIVPVVLQAWTRRTALAPETHDHHAILPHTSTAALSST